MEIIWLVWLIIIIALYFIPTLIAFQRKSTVKSLILVLNLFTGWLMITWLIYLIWASSSETEQDVEIRKLQLENLRK